MKTTSSEFSSGRLLRPDAQDVNDLGSVWGDPEREPVTIPSLPFTAHPPEKELYRAAFKAAYRYPDALMLVMQGVRKGLKRGKKTAEKAGGLNQ